MEWCRICKEKMFLFLKQNLKRRHKNVRWNGLPRSIFPYYQYSELNRAFFCDFHQLNNLKYGIYKLRCLYLVLIVKCNSFVEVIGRNVSNKNVIVFGAIFNSIYHYECGVFRWPLSTLTILCNNLVDEIGFLFKISFRVFLFMISWWNVPEKVRY